MLNKYRKWLGKTNSKNNQCHDSSESIQLIEGTFDPIDAADVLLSLVTYKIKFHNLQLLHLEENSAISKAQSERRIMELKEAKNRITQIIMNARNNGNSIEINSNIQIKVIASN